MLTEEHAKGRKKWAQEHGRWDVNKTQVEIYHMDSRTCVQDDHQQVHRVQTPDD